MNNKKIKYRERVPASRLLRTGAALSVALLFWWVLGQNIYSTSGRTAAFIPSLIFILAFTLLGYGILSMFYGVRIRITRQGMIDGTRQQILKIRGVSRSDNVNISLQDIRDVQLESYNVPLWRALLGPLGRQKYSGGHMVTLPGHQGTGLAVTYTYETIFSSGSKEVTVLFPTGRPEELQDLLAVAGGGADPNSN